MASENVGTIAQAYVQIMPSTQGIKGQLASVMGAEADSAGKSAGGKFAGAFGTATKALAGGFAAAAAGSVALGKTLISQVGDFATYGDNVDKMSQKMGISAQAYQEWDAILQHSGSSIDAMLPSMKSLAVAAEGSSKEAAAAFDAIGLSQEAIASMSQEQLFEATIKGLQGVGDETERMYLASKLLGRGATELGPLLNTSAEDVEAMRQRVHDLGGVMSDEAVKSAAAYQDNLQDMQTAFAGLKNNLAAEFLPGITTVMQGLTQVLSGDNEEGLGAIADGISAVVEKITEKAPQIIETVAGLAEKLVPVLVDAIIANAPMLIEAGITLITTLASALITNIPTLVKAIPQILEAIVRGLANGTKDLRESGRKLIESTKQAFMDGVRQARQWGRDLIQSFIDGLLSKFNSLRSTVKSAAQTVKNFLGFSEPSEGPLSDFHTYAPDMVELWNQGLRDSEAVMRRQLTQSFSLRPAILSAAESAAPAASAAGSAAAAQTPQLVGVFKIGEREFARAVFKPLKDMERAEGVSLIANFA